MTITNTYDELAPTSRYILPQHEERTAYGSRSRDPYSMLFADRIIFLSAPVDGTSASDIVAQLLALDSSSKEDIKLYINSPGGSISDMAMIVDTMNLVTSNVSTICLGMAASAASVILAAGTKGKRFALPNSSIMIHQPRTGGSSRGQASDLRVQADQIKKTRDWIELIMSERTGQPVEKLHADMERDKYMTAKEAVEYGIVDKIIGSEV